MTIILSLLILIIIGFFAFGMFLPTNVKYSITPDDKFIEIDGNKIRYKYVDRKSLNTIVFLHSFGGKLEMWDSLSSYFTAHNLLSYDMIGFGKSDKPDIDYSIATQSNFLIKILDKLKIENCILIGSSMGASTTAWSGAKYPDRIKSIVLFAPSGYPGSMNHSFPGNYFYQPGLLNTIGEFVSSTSLFKLCFPNSLGKQTFNVTASYNQHYVNNLKNISQPTLLIWSEGDNRSLFNYASNYLREIKNSKLIKKPAEAGHNCPAYKPKETAEEIKNYLNLLDNQHNF